jgi:hypothetical protein
MGNPKVTTEDLRSFKLKVSDVDTDEPLVALMVITGLLQVVKVESEATSEKEKASIAMMIAMMEQQFRKIPEEEKQPLRTFLMENLESFVKELRDSIDTTPIS